MTTHTIKISSISNFFIANTKSAPIWLLIRLYVGWVWISAGLDKIHDSSWVGNGAGTSLTKFVHYALTKTGGVHPDVQGWYATFLEHVVLPHVVFWSYLVVAGELLVGFALIFGLFVGISAFFGIFMNLNYMLAGTVSINPILFTLGIGLVLAWRVAGYWGLDIFALPALKRVFGQHNKPKV